MTTQLLDILKDLSLHENAAKIYLACLELGPSSIWDIAKKSGIKRPTCYVILEELAWKGLASSENDGRRTKYSVVSPKQLALMEERRHSRFLNGVSELQSIASKSKNKPVIRTFEGKEGIAQVYNLILALPKGTPTYAIGSNLLSGKFSNVLTEFVESRKKKGIPSQVLFPDTPADRALMVDRKNEQREMRFLPANKFDPRTSTNIFGDTVAYIVHGEDEPFATVIESASLAEDEKQRFLLLWDIAKE
ncbi:MAG: helix-turn-helix domain-containing protein [Patescibacteria group bacterium]